MSNTNTTEDLRNRYFSNELFRIGDLVEDVNTKEQMKILDRGSNYVTVATSNGIIKKWLNEVVEPAPIVVEATKVEPIVEEVKADVEFELLPSGQIKLFGYETKAFNEDLSTIVLEQFSEFSDLYSKHQIIKCLDLALLESNCDTGFALLEKVDNFYNKQNICSPFIVESKKNDFERRKITEILASVAGVAMMDSYAQTITAIIKEFRSKYKTKQQWDVLNPFFDVAYSYGLTNAKQNLPYASPDLKECLHDEVTFEVFEENLEMIVDDLEFEDISEAFEDAEFSDDVSEALSIDARASLSRKLKQRESALNVRRERAMTKSASTDVLLARARKLAETMLKRRMFKKPVGELSRQEKERFEAGAFKRRAIVARLALKLVPKVRLLQSARLHHEPAQAQSHHTTSAVGAS